MELRVVVGFVIGLVVGSFGVWLLQGETEAPGPSGVEADAPNEDAPTDPQLATTRRPAGESTEAEPSTRAAAPTAPTPSAESPPPTASTQALIDARAESLRATAAERIRQAMQTEQNADSIARAQIELEMAAEAARLADLERGGLLELIHELDDEWIAPQTLLSSAERFGAFFERRTQGGALDVDRANASPDEIADGDTIRVPAGRWSLDTQKLHRAKRGKAFPQDLLIEGAGMDTSVLVLNDEFDISATIVNLTFRDLTVHCNNNYFTQFRGEFTLRLERCRIVGFDMGAGGSTAFNGRDGALFATDCRIEAGFGRSPYRGNLWRVRGVFLARLENCTIVGPIDDLGPRGRGGLIVYDGCRFVDIEERERTRLEKHRGVILMDCRFETKTPEDPERGRRTQRTIAELNPAWSD